MRYLLFILLLAVSAHANTEVCGDGVDNDGAGGDAFCAGSDQDRDGYESDVDCDDLNRYVYPGVHVACDSGGGPGTGWQTCESDGDYSTCTENDSAALCEATGGGDCYYIDPVNGNDTTGDGSWATPWASFANVKTYNTAGERPGNWVSISAGDVVYALGGADYTGYYTLDIRKAHTGWWNVTGTASNPVIISNYPGHSPTIKPGCNSGTGACSCIQLQNVDHFVIEGFTCTDGYGGGTGGIAVLSSRDVEIRNNTVYDYDGNASGNTAGIYFNNATETHYVHHNLVHNNYDRSDPTSDNNANIVFLGNSANGGEIEVAYNVVYHDSVSGQRTCIKHKHGTPDGSMNVHHNIIQGCGRGCLSVSTSSVTMQYNICTDSSMLYFRQNQGGGYYINGDTVQYNTGINTRGVWYRVAGRSAAPTGVFNFSNNVIVYNQVFAGEPTGMIVADYYGIEADYNLFVPDKFSFSENCYWNQGSDLWFNLWGASSATFGEKFTSLSAWQGAGYGYDLDSFGENPGLDANQVAQSANCVGKGWVLGEGEPAQPPTGGTNFLHFIARQFSRRFF